jgi:hypothetical protein
MSQAINEHGTPTRRSALGFSAAAIIAGLSALTGTDPLLLMEVEPANAHEFVIRSAASSSLFDAARLHQFLCSAENRFFVLAYVSVSAARSGGQARSGATRSHAQRSTASMARIASTGP